MRPSMRRALTAAVPVIALPVALLASPGTALAGGPPATIHITGQATLLADGSVTLDVVYSCLPNPSGAAAQFLTAVLEQGSGAAAGRVPSTSITCDGDKHSVTLDLTPFAGTITTGDAAATAFVQSENQFAQDSSTVKVSS